MPNIQHIPLLIRQNSRMPDHRKFFRFWTESGLLLLLRRAEVGLLQWDQGQPRLLGCKLSQGWKPSTISVRLDFLKCVQIVIFFKTQCAQKVCPDLLGTMKICVADEKI